MTPKEQAYYNEKLNKYRETLILTVVALRIKLDGLSSYDVSNADALAAMHRGFTKCREERDTLKAENDKLRADLERVAENNRLLTKVLYGTSSEKLEGLVNSDESEEIIDEAETEDSNDGQEEPAQEKKSTRKAVPHGQRSKNAGSRRVDFDALPQQSCFIMDKDIFDEKYGRGDWRIAFWKKKRT